MFYYSGNVVRDDSWDDLFPVNVLPNGLLFWAPAGEFLSSCELNMAKFPMDRQVSLYKIKYIPVWCTDLV